MCIIPATHRYERIANNTALSASLRNAAKQQLINDKTFHAVMKAAEPTTGPGAPTKNNKEFKCRIFSMGSSWPDKSKKYDDDEEDAPDLGPNVTKHPLPGILIRDQASILAISSDGKVLEDEAREKCFEGLRATYDLYKFFGRNSLDDQGKELVASIHIGIGYGNAYWCVDQMFFGDGGSGRGIMMPGATIPDNLCSWYCAYDLDTIGHELTHGLVQETAGLGGSVMADTLNESIADCFGMMVKQKANNLTVHESDWDISPGWWADTTIKAHNWTKNYCRTFRNPAKGEAELEPKHMSEWVQTTDPHQNCGIPNHAFYLAALEFGGYAWMSVGQIWFEVLRDPSFKKREKQDFKGFALLTCDHARRLYGSKAKAILMQAWSKVGVLNNNDFGIQYYTTADERSRWDCSTGQYHSVVVVSEDLINAQLESYYHLFKDLREMKVENPGLKIGIDAELDPPRIQIPRNATDRTKVIYHLRLKKATIKYTEAVDMAIFDPETYPEHRPISVDVKDWDFAFQVNLGGDHGRQSEILAYILIDLESVKDAEQVEVRKMLRVAGEYSIQRLMLNFGMANTSNFISELSELRMPDGSMAPGALCDSLGGWIKTWTVKYDQIEHRLQGNVWDKVKGKMYKSKSPILYHALAPDPSKVNFVTPHITPTAVIMQTYHFERPDGKGIESTNRNSIAYTEMCGGAALPPQPILASSNGNFVTDDKPWRLNKDLSISDSNILGSTCLSSERLFESFWVPRLNPIVKMTHVNIIRCATNTSGGDSEYQWDLGFDGNPKNPDYSDKYYLMTRMPGNDTMFTEKTWFGAKGDNAGECENKWGYRWVMEKTESLDSESTSTFKDTSMTVEARSICNLVPQAGTNKVRLSGCTTVAIHIRNKKWLKDPQRIGFATTGFWKMEFVINTNDGVVEDGHLDVGVKYDDPFVTFLDWKVGAGVSGFDYNAAINQMKSKLRGNLDGLKDYLEKTVKPALKQTQFVLAGSGYFTLRNPIFTTKGDLLCEIKYKGIPPNGDPKDYRPQQLAPMTGSLPQVPAFVNEPQPGIPSQLTVKA